MHRLNAGLQVDLAEARKAAALTSPTECGDREGRLAWLEEALSAARGSGRRRIAEEGVRLVDLLLRKNADYGSAAWRAPVLAPHMGVRSAILVRASDKIARLAELSAPDVEIRCDETVEDTVRDLAGYCLLYLATGRGPI